MVYAFDATLFYLFRLTHKVRQTEQKRVWRRLHDALLHGMAGLC